MRRFLPIVIVAFVVLIGAQTLFKKKSNGPTSASTTAAQTISATDLIAAGEQAYKTANGRFTSNLADLLQLKPHLGAVLGGISVALAASTDGHTYIAHVTSSVLDLTRAFDDAKLTSRSCTVLKSSSGVDCPKQTP